MKVIFLLCISMLVGGGWAWPEPSSAQAAAASGTTKTKVKKKKRTRVSRAELRFGGMLWQEAIEMDKGSDKVDAEMQSAGLFVGYGRSTPFRGLRWSYYYGAELGVGTIKGRALSNAAINDGLNNQLWYLVGANPGIIYRTTAYTELGLYVPVWFRMINWKINANSSLDPDRDSSFSLGLQGQMVQRFSKSSALAVSITHQQFWGATAWGVTWLHTYQ